MADRIETRVFERPPAEYRPVPFWGLTGVLRQDELLKQIEEMKDKGWGGFFMHARYPLVTPYLGDEYMEIMRACVLKAKELGLKAWIYDDHPWCSGSAGGLTASIKKEYRSKALALNVHHRLTPIDPDEAVGYYALRLDGRGVPSEAVEITDPENYHGRERYFLHFFRFTEPLLPHYEPGFYDDCVVHGFASADNLNPKAVQRYLDITYNRFYETVGEAFGDTLMGGFSDMPTYNWNYSTPHPSVPWTDGFEDFFRSLYGYDIAPHLPKLFFDLGGDFKKIRCDYWKAAARLFAESFTKQCFEWADRHNCIYSGHYWGEETLHWQIPWAGDVMEHFLYQQYVGMDHSVKTIEDPAGVKQAATVAEQLGRPRMMAESYGLSGNGLSHKQRKWIADWEYALGANFLIPYIAQCSLKGRAKRDEPASIFVQQPYWPYEKPLYDHYARLSYALTRGKREVSILLMQPLETARAMYSAGKTVSHCYRPDDTFYESADAELYEYNNHWMALHDRLLALHRDYHIGSESVMLHLGSHAENGLLHVGRYAYPVVIVPGSESWSQNTCRVLGDFASQGGSIIAIEPLPTLIGGVPAKRVLPENVIVIPETAEALENALDAVLAKDIVLPNCPDILYHHRRTDNAEVYFLANTSTTGAYPATPVRFPGKAGVRLLDTFTGRSYRVPSVHENGFTAVSLDFEPVNSFLLELTQESLDGLPEYRATPRAFERELPLGDGWTLASDDPNALVLDYCDIKLGDSPWARLPVFQAQQRAQQAGVGTPYAIRYVFDVRDIPSRLQVTLEDPDRVTAALNGEKLVFPEGEWWIDPAFRLADLTAAVRRGENTLEFHGVVGLDTELENSFLIGDMGVDTAGGFHLTAPRKKVVGQDLTAEGYPFFTGSVRLCKTVRVNALEGRAFLTFDRLSCTLARVWVNGQSAGFLAWEPFTLDVTEWLAEGDNQIEVELITTRRNLFGPHHYKFREEETFSVPARWVNEAYWMDDYYFAPLGVENARIGFLA